MTVIRAEMSATVLGVNVAEGERVDAGTEVVLLESMKMEIPVKSPAAGTVQRVVVKPGDLVSDGDALVELSAEE